MPPQSSSVSIRCLARIAGIPRFFKQVWGAATWQTSQRYHTLLLLVSWPVFCYGFHYAFPLLVFYASYSKQQAISVASSKKEEDAAAADERLERALETLDFIDRLERVWDVHCHWQIMIWVVSAWIGLITVFQPWQVMWTMGTVFVLANHPLLTAIWKGCMPTVFLHSLWLALVNDPSSEESDPFQRNVSLTQHVEDFQRKHMQANTPSCEFEFVIYENQRSWPLSGWKAQTFPIIDRGTWTDSTKKPVRPKSQFELPETIHAGTRTWTWRWAENEWRLANPTRSQGDELGWMYGTPFWSVFDAEHKGWISTRRRRWARKAVLSCMPPPSRASSRDSLPTPVSAPPSTGPQQRSLSIITTPSQTPTPTSPPVSPTPSKKGGINLSSLTLDSFTSSSNLKRSQTQSATSRRESGTSWKSIVRVKR